MQNRDLARDIENNLSRLYRPGDVIELRILGVSSRPVISGYFDDFGAAAETAARYDGRGNIYHVINPVKQELLELRENEVKNSKRATGDNQVALRRYFFIDCDPVRPSNVASTKMEHKAALKKSREIVAWLRGQMGFPELFRADSGNGAHILVPVDFPNDPQTTGLCKAFIASIRKQFEDAQVKIDTQVTNAARLIRLWGTLNMKGGDTDDRPHRYSRLLDYPGRDR